MLGVPLLPHGFSLVWTSYKITRAPHFNGVPFISKFTMLYYLLTKLKSTFWLQEGKGEEVGIPGPQHC